MIVCHASQNDRHPITIFSVQDAASLKLPLMRNDRRILQDEARDLLFCIVLCHEREFSSI